MDRTFEVLTSFGLDLTDQAQIHNLIVGNLPPIPSNTESCTWPRYEKSIPEDSVVEVNQFCQRCKDLRHNSKALLLLQRAQRPSERITKEMYEYCTVSELRASYLEGCHLCALFWDALANSAGSKWDENCSKDIVWLYIVLEYDVHIWDGNAEIYKDFIEGDDTQVNLRVSLDKVAIESTSPIYVYPNTHKYCAKPLAGAKFPVSSRSDSAFCTIRNWLTECLAHEQCNKFQQTIKRNDRPSRLLYLEGGKVSLCCDATKIQKLHAYTTLSHRWGDPAKIPQLKQNTLEAFKANIPLESLTESFRDAIRVTLALGFTHLWIDSLCIIQDSREDWEQEGRRMAAIYGGSVCNISYIGGSSDGVSDMDLAYLRDPRIYLPCHWAKEPDMSLLVIQPFGEQWGRRKISEIFDLPLLTRAWVFQERLLCPRTIYYGGSQLVWECVSGVMSELSGNNPNQESTKRTFYDTFDMSKPTPFDLVPHRASEYRRYEFRRGWMEIVTQYRETKLTYESDRVIALSGIMDAVQMITSYTPIAGLWKETIIPDLCWTTALDTYQSRGMSSGRELLVPSWTWFAAALHRDMASSESYPQLPPKEKEKDVGLWVECSEACTVCSFPQTRIVYTAKVLHCILPRPIPAPPRNEFSGATLTIQSFALSGFSLSWSENQLRARPPPEWLKLDFHYWHDEDVEPGSILPQPLALLLLLDYVEDHPPNARSQIGLAICPLGENLWRRVGLFRSVHKGEDGEYQGPSLHIPALFDIVSSTEMQVVLV